MDVLSGGGTLTFHNNDDIPLSDINSIGNNVGIPSGGTANIVNNALIGGTAHAFNNTAAVVDPPTDNSLRSNVVVLSGETAVTDNKHPTTTNTTNSSEQSTILQQKDSDIAANVGKNRTYNALDAEPSEVHIAGKGKNTTKCSGVSGPIMSTLQNNNEINKIDESKEILFYLTFCKTRLTLHNANYLCHSCVIFKTGKWHVVMTTPTQNRSTNPLVLNSKR